MSSPAREPAALPAGLSLPGHYYTDTAIFADDLAWLAGRWLCVGHGSEWDGVGARRVARLGRDEAVIVRGDDGALRAFANVCRHRGSRLCDEAGSGEAGSGRMLLCPYHGWRYGLDGRLVAAPAMPAGFAPAAHGLTRLNLAEQDGLIFLSFGDDPPAIGPGLAALGAMTGRRMRLRRTGSWSPRLTMNATIARRRTRNSRPCMRWPRPAGGHLAWATASIGRRRRMGWKYFG